MQVIKADPTAMTYTADDVKPLSSTSVHHDCIGSRVRTGWTKTHDHEAGQIVRARRLLISPHANFNVIQFCNFCDAVKHRHCDAHARGPAESNVLHTFSPRTSKGSHSQALIQGSCHESVTFQSDHLPWRSDRVSTISPATMMQYENGVYYKTTSMYTLTNQAGEFIRDLATLFG